jgi:hypothetical protein
MAIISALTLVAAVNAYAVGTNVQHTIVQTMEIVEKQYCPASGEAVLKVRLRIVVKNKSKNTFILTKAATVSHYDIRGTNVPLAGKPPLLAYTLPKEEPFDAGMLDSTQPPTELFDVVGPEASVDRIVLVDLWVKNLQLRMKQPSGTFWLSVRVQYWPWSEVAASELRQSWSRFGNLWTRPVEAAPVELSIERNPKIEKCIGRID